MGNFKIIENKNQIKLGRSWTDSLEFNAKNKIAHKNGHHYRLNGKERNLSGFEMAFRRTIAVIINIFTCRIFKYSKFMRVLNATTAKKRFGIEIELPILPPQKEQKVTSQQPEEQIKDSLQGIGCPIKVGTTFPQVGPSLEQEYKQKHSELKLKLEERKAELKNKMNNLLIESDHNAAKLSAEIQLSEHDLANVKETFLEQGLKRWEDAVNSNFQKNQEALQRNSELKRQVEEKLAKKKMAGLEASGKTED